jgi:hypothetical protein
VARAWKSLAWFQNPSTLVVGDFSDAVRVETRAVMAVNTTVDGNSVNMEFPFTFTAWYAEGIGLLRSTSETDMGGGVTELISIESVQ